MGKESGEDSGSRSLATTDPDELRGVRVGQPAHCTVTEIERILQRFHHRSLRRQFLLEIPASGRIRFALQVRARPELRGPRCGRAPARMYSTCGIVDGRKPKSVLGHPVGSPHDVRFETFVARLQVLAEPNLHSRGDLSPMRDRDPRGCSTTRPITRRFMSPPARSEARFTDVMRANAPSESRSPERAAVPSRWRGQVAFSPLRPGLRWGRLHGHSTSGRNRIDPAPIHRR